MLWKALAQEERGPLWHNNLSFLEMFVLLKGEKKNIVAREINTLQAPWYFVATLIYTEENRHFSDKLFLCFFVLSLFSTPTATS